MPIELPTYLPKCLENVRFHGTTLDIEWQKNEEYPWHNIGETRMFAMAD